MGVVRIKLEKVTLLPSTSSKKSIKVAKYFHFYFPIEAS